MIGGSVTDLMLGLCSNPNFFGFEFIGLYLKSIGLTIVLLLLYTRFLLNRDWISFFIAVFIFVYFTFLVGIRTITPPSLINSQLYLRSR